MKLKLARAKALQSREQDVLRHVGLLLRRGDLRGGADRRAWERELAAHLDRLDLLARTVRDTPSLYDQQQIGPRHRDIHSLVDSLSRSTAFDFELHMPLRALIGRTLLMAKVNFFRLIRHIVSDALAPDESTAKLSSRLERVLCTCIYTKIAEEILTAITCDDRLEPAPRRKAAATLCQLWEDRVTPQVTDFFAVLQSAWEARRKTKVGFGALTGISELFDLLRAGCDERFIDLFSRQAEPATGDDSRLGASSPTATLDKVQHDWGPQQIDQDRCMAFQEFLFQATGPELDVLMNHVRTTSASINSDRAAELLDSEPQRFDLSSQAAEKMYESFRRRHLTAAAGRARLPSRAVVPLIAGTGEAPAAGLPSAFRTAEEYIFLHLLAQTDLETLIAKA